MNISSIVFKESAGVEEYTLTESGQIEFSPLKVVVTPSTRAKQIRKADRPYVNSEMNWSEFQFNFIEGEEGDEGMPDIYFDYIPETSVDGMTSVEVKVTAGRFGSFKGFINDINTIKITTKMAQTVTIKADPTPLNVKVGETLTVDMLKPRVIVETEDTKTVLNFDDVFTTFSITPESFDAEGDQVVSLGAFELKDSETYEFIDTNLEVNVKVTAEDEGNERDPENFIPSVGQRPDIDFTDNTANSTHGEHAITLEESYGKEQYKGIPMNYTRNRHTAKGPQAKLNI